MKNTNNKTATEINDIPSFGLELKHIDGGGSLFEMKNNKICGIYKITSPSGCIYIGQSRDLKARLSSYKRLCDRHKVQTRLYNSFVKYGPENHTFEILCECPIDNLNELEEYYIRYFDTFNTPLGLNLTSGGNFIFTMSEETKAKLSERMKQQKLSPEHLAKLIAGNKNRPYKPLTQEHKDKLSKSLTGRKMPKSYSERLSKRNTGRIVTQETREKIRKALIGSKRTEEAIQNMRKAQIKINKKGEKCHFFGKPWTKEQKISHSEKIKAYHKNNYQYLCQVSLDGFLVKVWDSRKEASLETGIKAARISDCVHHRQKTAGGFIWK